jgi:monofunctional biosynthetic peptidoglycan transglycosylase
MKKRIRRRPIGGRILRGLGLLLLAGIALSVALVLAFRWLPVPTSSVMLQSRLAGEVVVYRWVPWDSITAELALAVIASEDQRFPQHSGFDLESIREAVADFRAGDRLRGASTISQQVAKNLFLSNSRSVLRKGAEVWFTLLLEGLWSKRRILEVYLNIAEMGPGIYGVGAASERYFDRSPARLRREQAALLAAVLPNPKKLSVARPSAYVRDRQRWILGQMRSLGGTGYLAGIVEPAS